MSRKSDAAFKAAQEEIARVKAAGETVLDLGFAGALGDKAKDLQAIPPEIAELSNATTLDFSGTQVSDLSPIAEMTWVTDLTIFGTKVRYLNPVSGMAGMRKLFLAGAPVSDLTPTAGMASLKTLMLSDTKVSDLSPIAEITGLKALLLPGTPVTDLGPLAGMFDLRRLDISRTQVSDLSPIRGLTGIVQMDLSHTQVSDLAPIAAMSLLAEQPTGLGVTFGGTPATRKSHQLLEIERISGAKERGRALLEHLGGILPPLAPEPDPLLPPKLPDRRPAALEVKIVDGQLERRYPEPPLPDGLASTRAEIGWNEVKGARDDFTSCLNLDNYRRIKTAIHALDRGMGARFNDLNQIAVGLVGDRLARLAADADLARTLPEGAASELAALAASVQLLADRFPEWVVYERGEEQEALTLIPAAEQALGRIEQALEDAPEEVRPEVTDELRDEVELARENPLLSEAVRAVLSSTRELVRVLAENVMAGVKAGLKAAMDKAKAEGRAFRRITPDEIRKWTLRGGVGSVLTVAWDVMFHQSTHLLTLANSYPQLFGWIPSVLRYLGAI